MKKNDVVTLSMAERRAEGLLWVDTGENMNQQIYARGLCQDFNQTRATETGNFTEIAGFLRRYCVDRTSAYTVDGKNRFDWERHVY